MIVWRKDECSLLFMKSCKREENQRRVGVHPVLGGNINIGLLMWVPSVLTTTPFHFLVHSIFLVKLLEYFL